MFIVLWLSQSAGNLRRSFLGVDRADRITPAGRYA